MNAGACDGMVDVDSGVNMRELEVCWLGWKVQCSGSCSASGCTGLCMLDAF